MSQEILLTTASTLDGYKIVKQYGLVFGDSIFKHFFVPQANSAVFNAVLGARELEGAVSLLEEKREYACSKMISEAEKIGANAIVAITTHYITENGVMVLSIYGTAVKVIKEEEYMASEEDRMQTLLHHKQLKERRTNGEELAEDGFLAAIANDMTMASILEKWEKAGIALEHPHATDIIREKKATEDKFGSFTRTQMDAFKNDLKTILLGE